jgi:hypothetical protein
MRFGSFVLIALFVTLATNLTHPSYAAPVDPYTENFATDSAQWLNGPQTGFANWVASGGPDGSSYISASMDTVGTTLDGAKVLFRGNSTTSPPIHASNDEFLGDWLAGGIGQFSVYVYHEAPEALPYFARFAKSTGFPGVAAEEGTLVQPFTWTKLNYGINPSQIGSTLFPETTTPGTELATYNSVFTDIGRVQIGFSVPASMVGSANTYLYAIDQVSVAIPEPASAVLLVAGAFAANVRRRRRIQ